MSLFCVKDWWSTRPGSQEEFSPGGLVVAALDLEGGAKVISGSFSGMLRIYNPTDAGYRVDDLLLETSLDAPILQLAVGEFLSNSPRPALAVLHPRKISIYSVQFPGSTESSKSLGATQLRRCSEHTLTHPAYNMATGSFGGAIRGQHICVQSLDGHWTVLEHEQALALLGRCCCGGLPLEHEHFLDAIARQGHPSRPCCCSRDLYICTMPS